jgi:hypothetical protein
MSAFRRNYFGHWWQYARQAGTGAPSSLRLRYDCKSRRRILHDYLSDSPVQAVNFGAPLAEIENQLLYLVPKGSTALLNALYLGITKIRSAKYSRRAILIVSDGGDNRSRYTEREVGRIAKEADVMIYAIGIYDRLFETKKQRLGPTLLADLSDLTGGRDCDREFQ